jgi:hypothetical protein
MCLFLFLPPLPPPSLSLSLSPAPALSHPAPPACMWGASPSSVSWSSLPCKSSPDCPRRHLCHPPHNSLKVNFTPTSIKCVRALSQALSHPSRLAPILPCPCGHHFELSVLKAGFDGQHESLAARRVSVVRSRFQQERSDDGLERERVKV